MGKLSARKKRVKQRVKIGKVAPETVAHVESLDARVEALQLLIPWAYKRSPTSCLWHEAG